jgi:hypothetical protein
MLPMEGVTDAVVLLDVRRVINKRGSHTLMPAAKKPLEKACARDAGFRGRDSLSVRRGRLWHGIKMREPHLAVNTAETVPFEETTGPTYAPKLVARGGGLAPLITSSISTKRPASASAMPCLKSSEVPANEQLSHALAPSDAEWHNPSKSCLARTRTHSKTASIQGQNDQVATLCATESGAECPDIAEIVTSWAGLPLPLKAAVLAIVRAHRDGEEGR